MPVLRRTAAFLVIGVLLIAVAWLAIRERRRSVPDAPAVVAQIRQLNQLVTVRYTVQKVIGLREPKYPVGEESILLVLQATVDAGVDLASLAPDDVIVENDRVTIHLPPASITNITIDEQATQVWDRRKTWWTPWIPYSKDLEGKARLAGIDAARQAALEMGVLKQAERNAETSIRSLLTLAGVREVRIVPPGIT